MTYKELVTAVGPGFHPDTYGSHMRKLPDGIDIFEYDRIVNQAHTDMGASIYNETMRIFLEQGWVKT